MKKCFMMFSLLLSSYFFYSVPPEGMPHLSQLEQDEYSNIDANRTPRSLQQTRKIILEHKARWAAQKAPKATPKTSEPKSELPVQSKSPGFFDWLTSWNAFTLSPEPSAQAEQQDGQESPPVPKVTQAVDSTESEQKDVSTEKYKPTGFISKVKAFVFREQPEQTQHREMLESVRLLRSKCDAQIKNIENIWGEAKETKSCWEIKFRIAQQYEQQITMMLDTLTRTPVDSSIIIDDKVYDSLREELDKANQLLAGIQTKKGAATPAKEFTSKQIIHILKWAFVDRMYNASFKDILGIMAKELPDPEKPETTDQEKIKKFIENCLTDQQEQTVFMNALSQVTTQDLQESVILFKDAAIDFFTTIAIGASVQFKKAAQEAIKTIKQDFVQLGLKAALVILSDLSRGGVEQAFVTVITGVFTVAFKVVRVMLTPLIALGRYALGGSQSGRAFLAWFISAPIATVAPKLSFAYVNPELVDDKDRNQLHQNQTPAEFRKALTDVLYEKRSLKAGTGKVMFKPAEQLEIIDQLWQSYADGINEVQSLPAILDKPNASYDEKLQAWITTRPLTDIIRKVFPGTSLVSSEHAIEGLNQIIISDTKRLDVFAEELLNQSHVANTPENKQILLKLRVLKVLADMRQQIKNQDQQGGVIAIQQPSDSLVSQAGDTLWSFMGNLRNAFSASQQPAQAE